MGWHLMKKRHDQPRTEENGRTTDKMAKLHKLIRKGLLPPTAVFCLD